MERVIVPAAMFVLNLVAVAVAFGRLMVKVERNEMDIEKVLSNCKVFRDGCQNDLSKKIDILFTKLEIIQHTTNESLTEIKIQVARLQERHRKEDREER